jgi:2-dehydro-3-deoxyphosphooctonate aldolase (KDO 8-P synthase)
LTLVFFFAILWLPEENGSRPRNSHQEDLSSWLGPTVVGRLEKTSQDCHLEEMEDLSGLPRRSFMNESGTARGLMNPVRIGGFSVGAGAPLVLIAGPCVIEDYGITMRTAERLKTITSKHGVPFIFKSSYKKANRTGAGSFSGVGIEKALAILAEVKQKLDVPILTDIHSEQEVPLAAEVADVIQIPAFLCRQTELLQAAGRTGKAVNIKKGQFMAPEDMKHQADKVLAVGNSRIFLTERGTTFGYHNLVVDMRSLAVMRELGYPVILDATHSVQLPGADRGSETVRSGGQPEFIYPIARAGVAAGVDGLFVETHPNPKEALSDAGSQLHLDLLEELLLQVVEIDKLVKSFAI